MTKLECGEMGGDDSKARYDLEERTAKFGKSIIDFAKKVPASSLTNRLIDQLVGAGTSVGANYCEADDAVSKKEFRYKIGICEKEARETNFLSERFQNYAKEQSRYGKKRRSFTSSLQRYIGVQ